MDLWIGWTAVEREDDAQRMAREAVELRLAACVQIEGPVESFYHWEGKLEQSREYRLTFKFMSGRREALLRWLKETHPYDIPEWMALPAQSVNPAYRDWARREASVDTDV